LADAGRLGQGRGSGWDLPGVRSAGRNQVTVTLCSLFVSGLKECLEKLGKGRFTQLCVQAGMAKEQAEELAEALAKAKDTPANGR
jgi:hypothetical protein